MGNVNVAGISACPLLHPAPTASPQVNLSRAVHPLANELQAWQEEPRRRAAELLRTSLVFAEGAVHQHLQLLLPAFCK